MSDTIHTLQTKGIEIKRPTPCIDIDLSKLTLEQRIEYFKGLDEDIILEVRYKETPGDHACEGTVYYKVKQYIEILEYERDDK